MLSALPFTVNVVLFWVIHTYTISMAPHILSFFTLFFIVDTIADVHFAHLHPAPGPLPSGLHHTANYKTFISHSTYMKQVMMVKLGSSKEKPHSQGCTGNRMAAGCTSRQSGSPAVNLCW